MQLFYFIVAAIAAAQAVTIKFQNNYGSTIWVGSQGNDGKPAINEGGWEMAAGQQMDVDVDQSWAGRFWARTGCSFDQGGNGHCEVGDCGNVLKCNGAGGTPPVTLAEINFNNGGQHFYDISLVDGFSGPVSMSPTDQSGSEYHCTTASCTADVNGNCPNELRQLVGERTVGCNSACSKFNTDQYCCRGASNKPETCKSSDWPTNYAKYFKDQCPLAYSYAYDDMKSTFTCENTGYTIIFG